MTGRSGERAFARPGSAFLVCLAFVWLTGSISRVGLIPIFAYVCSGAMTIRSVGRVGWSGAWAPSSLLVAHQTLPQAELAVISTRRQSSCVI